MDEPLDAVLLGLVGGLGVFVGLFLARISRGRTIREFVVGTMVIPFAYIVMWVSIFGNAALERVRGGDEAFAEAAQNYDGRGFFMLVEQYPASGLRDRWWRRRRAAVLRHLRRLRGAGDGQPVLQPAARPGGLPRPGMRIVWAAVTGILTIAVLAVGGILALQYATVILRPAVRGGA